MGLVPELLFYTGAGTEVSVGLQISFRTDVLGFVKKKKSLSICNC